MPISEYKSSFSTFSLNGFNIFLLEHELDHSLRRQRVFRDRLNPLDMYSDNEFITFYRMDRIMFTESLNKFENYMIRSTSRSHAIPAAT